MKLLGRTTVPEDFDQCISDLRDTFLYSAEQLKEIRAMWATLLSRDIARSAVVFDEAEPRHVLAFGLSAPLKQARFDDIFRDAVPFVTKALLGEWLSGKEPFLDEPAYTSANAGSGLSTFVLHNGFSNVLTGSAFLSVLSKLCETFLVQHAGCRLRAVAHESFGVPPEFAVDLGLRAVDYAEPHTSELADCPADRTPSIVVVTREDAEQRPGNLTLNTLFLRFTPPLFCFNVAERRLLRFATEGESDPRIAELLQIAPRTLKKRWADIYLAMESVTGVPGGGSAGHRGAEARRHVLRYIRQHPEELHAYRSGRAFPAQVPLHHPGLSNNEYGAVAAGTTRANTTSLRER